MESGHGGLFGRIALHLKFVTQEQLSQAVEIYGRQGGQVRLGDLLLQMGFMDQRQVDQTLNFQREYEKKQKLKQEEAAHLGKMELKKLETKAPVTKKKRSVKDLPIAVGATPGNGSPAAASPAAPMAASSGKIDSLLQTAARHGASDLHIHVGYPLIMRLHGRLVTGKTAPYTAEVAEQELLEILTPQQRERFLATSDLGFAYEIPGMLRARATYCRQQRGGVDGVFRIIPSQVPALEDLGLPRDLARFTTFHQGLVLFTGPTGCGKSSTLAALIRMINEERQEHIIIVEDPIEYLHPSVRCLVRQRQVVDHTQTYDNALRAALREDPDIIVVGELRDRDTIALAISAAETGHLVYGSLHTNNAVRTINRILDAFPPEQAGQIRSMVSESLRGIISQRLVPNVDGTGRVPILEILTVNNAVSNLVREGKMFQIPGTMQVGRALGMRVLDDSLAEAVKAGQITREEALKWCESVDRFPA